MDGILYPASLLLLAVLAFTFNQTNNSKIALVMILMGVYLIYSHETGNTATSFKNDLVHDLDESAGNFSDKRGIKGYDDTESKNLLEGDAK